MHLYKYICACVYPQQQAYLFNLTDFHDYQICKFVNPESLKYILKTFLYGWIKNYSL